MPVYKAVDIDKLNNNVLNPASLSQTSTTLNTSSTVIKHSNDFNDLVKKNAPVKLTGA